MFRSRLNNSPSAPKASETEVVRADSVQTNAVQSDPESPPIPGLTSQQPSYWELSRQPLHSLVFLAPMVVGVELLKRSASSSGERPVAIGVESWIQSLLSNAGIHIPCLLPATLFLLLIGWHLVGRYRTGIRPSVLCGMAFESLMYACLLVVIGQMQDLFFQQIVYRGPLAIGGEFEVDFRSRIVTFVGAGLYEEVLFRLTLLPLIREVLKLLTLPHRLAAGFAVFFSSIAFAAAHHLTAEADPFSALTLSFRIVAGVFLSLLFLRRGFGVTAGCHTAYDVLVGVIMQSRN